MSVLDTFAIQVDADHAESIVPFPAPGNLLEFCAVPLMRVVWVDIFSTFPTGT
jgi:hypothetical protein